MLNICSRESGQELSDKILRALLDGMEACHKMASLMFKQCYVTYVGISHFICELDSKETDRLQGDRGYVTCSPQPDLESERHRG